MIEKKDGAELLSMIPQVFEEDTLPDIEDIDKDKYNLGDIIYNKEDDKLYQYMLFEYLDDQERIKETLYNLDKSMKDEEGNWITNSEIKSRVDKFRESFKNTIETAESNNLGYYLNEIDKLLQEENLTQIEIDRLNAKKQAIFDSTDFLFLNKTARLTKYDKTLYNNYRKNAISKMKTNKKLSFPPLNNDLLEALNICNPNVKENKMFLLHLYKYIAENQISEIGLQIYFTLINILGLRQKNNKLREMLEHNLKDQINYFNNK